MISLIWHAIDLLLWLILIVVNAIILVRCPMPGGAQVELHCPARERVGAWRGAPFGTLGGADDNMSVSQGPPGC